MSDAGLVVETIGRARVLTIDRPATKNALDRELVRRLGAAIREADGDASVRGVVLTGSGDGVFVSGGDLNEFAELVRAGVDGSQVLGMLDELGSIEDGDLPVVAAVQGDALGGGCELLLLCDQVVIEEHAALAFRHAKMGLTPAWGGVTRLLERVGGLEASRLLLSAERVGAADAARIGLVGEVVGRGQAKTRAVALVERIADNPRPTVAALKRALREVRQARRGEAIARERAIFAEMWGGPDHRRALRAFESRRP